MSALYEKMDGVLVSPEVMTYIFNKKFYNKSLNQPRKLIFDSKIILEKINLNLNL